MNKMVKNSILFAVVAIATFCSYSYGQMTKEKELSPMFSSYYDGGYKEGQLDAFQGKQIYESATFEDGTTIVLPRNEPDENI
jgi:hypothetical protein